MTMSFAAHREMQVGGLETLVGWNKFTPSGAYESTIGVNWGLGITYRRYFNRINYNNWNPYWHAGTLALIVPYAGVGIDYVTRDWYAGIGTYLLVPEIHFAVLF